MSNSYLNIVTFLATTIVYYMTFKPILTYSISSNPEEYKKYMSDNYLYLAIYFFAVLIIQFIVNSTVISNKCGGKLTQNMGMAAGITFLSWILIFGAIIVVLIAYPGFKTAFSDVVGYYYVSDRASKLLSELLINPEVKDSISSSEIDEENKSALEKAASTIIKICGSPSILINQIVPTNFDEYWNILQPLIKPDIKSDTMKLDEKREELFEIVMSRDNVGEAMWYIYTGLLLTSIVQLRIATLPCQLDKETIEQNMSGYLEEQTKIDERKEAATSQVYTL
jgi:hypothetical protein